MRVEVDTSVCEGHGQCAAVAPEVFDLDDDGYVIVLTPDVPAELQAAAESGANACPVQAITVVR